jgi:outer membrane protein OmpA-like peptidoglycan-associated protein
VDNLGCPLDSDGDGIADYLDRCAGTPMDAYGLIDDNGCPLDSDNDGVADYLDKCPDTPMEAFGFVDDKGCAIDTDEDGVADWKDECPNTPKDAKGYVNEWGCENDTDQDGVPDWRDQCPQTPIEAISAVDANGCEIDTDKDGVPDWKDQCPNTPIEAKGFVDTMGCEIDTDQDGVADWKDQCPKTPGSITNNGCPEMKKEVKNLLQKAMQGIEFETGKAIIKKSSYALLDEIATIFIENPSYIIEIQGHTDNVGNADMNKELSYKRANAVREYFISKGVDANRMTARGYGMEQPIADNNTKAGRAKNRRVQFEITYETISYEITTIKSDEQANQIDNINNY